MQRIWFFTPLKEKLFSKKIFNFFCMGKPIFGSRLKVFVCSTPFFLAEFFSFRSFTRLFKVLQIHYPLPLYNKGKGGTGRLTGFEPANIKVTV